MLVSYLVSARNSPQAVSQTLSPSYTLRVLSAGVLDGLLSLLAVPTQQPLKTSARFTSCSVKSSSISLTELTTITLCAANLFCLHYLLLKLNGVS